MPADDLRARLVADLLASWSVAEDATSTEMARVTAERNVDTILPAVRVAVERERQRTEAALAERDQQFERKCEALRERDAARNLAAVREKLLREAWDAHHATMDERDVLEAELAEVVPRTLNAAADKLFALPATDGAALKGPYWYRQGFTQAADLLRDWADYPAALDAPQTTETTTPTQEKV